MSLVAGSVSVDEDEVVTGTGYARALYDADVATMTLPTLPTLGSTSPPYTAARPVAQTDIDLMQAQRVRALQEAARRANAYASATVTYFQANAVARVTSESLGRLPASITTGTPIDAPSSPVNIPIF